jgi:hypothetical protein
MSIGGIEKTIGHLVDHYQVYTRGDTRSLCHFRKWLALRPIFGGKRLEVLTDAGRKTHLLPDHGDTVCRRPDASSKRFSGVEADTHAAMGNDDARRSATLRQ